MSLKSILQQKAALYFAAFFIFTTLPVTGKEPETLGEVKKKAIEFLLKKQKGQALDLVSSYLKIDANKNSFSEANELIVKLSQTFLSKEAQDAYEASVNSVLENPKESMKQIEICLQLEPENIDCLIQKIRLAYREKNKSTVDSTFQKMGEFAKGTSPYLWVDLYLQKDLVRNEYKDKNALKKPAERPTEETFIMNVIEIERGFLGKNYSRVRSGIEYLEKKFPDYPDTVYFKQKLDYELAEDKSQNSSDANLLYATKCKSMTRSVARRFRYDFALCKRGS